MSVEPRNTQKISSFMEKLLDGGGGGVENVGGC